MNLRKAIEEAGFQVGNVSDEALVKVAVALGIPLPRTVSFSEYKGGNYAQIAPIPYKDSEGKERKTKPFSVRVEAIDTLISDLQRAKEQIVP